MLSMQLGKRWKKKKRVDGRNKLQGEIKGTGFLYKGNKWDKSCFLW